MIALLVVTRSQPMWEEPAYNSQMLPGITRPELCLVRQNLPIRQPRSVVHADFTLYSLLGPSTPYALWAA